MKEGVGGAGEVVGMMGAPGFLPLAQWGVNELTRARETHTQNRKMESKEKTGTSFFGIEMSFLWYRGGLSLLFGALLNST